MVANDLTFADGIGVELDVEWRLGWVAGFIDQGIRLDGDYGAAFILHFNKLAGFKNVHLSRVDLNAQVLDWRITLDDDRGQPIA